MRKMVLLPPSFQQKYAALWNFGEIMLTAGLSGNRRFFRWMAEKA